MSEIEKREFWVTFMIGLSVGAFVGWQLWFSVTLYQWANRRGDIIHNYMSEIL